MKRSVLVLLMGCLLASFAGGAAAREKIAGDTRLARLEDPVRITFPRDAANLNRQKIRQAIDAALAYRKWNLVKESPGSIDVTTTVNEKHVVNIRIAYDDAGYEITYLDSIDLLYQETTEIAPPGRVIHKNYNVWILQLIRSINNGLSDVPGAIKGVRTTSANAAVAGNAASATPVAAFASLDNLDAVPVNPKGRERYVRFLAMPSPRAFTVGADGSGKIFNGQRVMDQALKHCLGRKCWVYAVDDQVFWHADPAKRIPVGAQASDGSQ